MELAFGWGGGGKGVSLTHIRGWCHKTCRAPLHLGDRSSRARNECVSKDNFDCTWFFLTFCVNIKHLKKKKENSESFCESRAQTADDFCNLLYLYIYRKQDNRCWRPLSISHQTVQSHLTTGISRGDHRTTKGHCSHDISQECTRVDECRILD